jgi:predicted RNase H-like nuclease (RuvC/YqgF family)
MHAINQINSCRLKNDDHLKSKYLKRWKFFLKLKKLYEYHLTSTQNKLSPKLSPLFQAFKKWKSHFSSKEDYLHRSAFCEVQEYYIATKSVISEVKNDLEAQKEAIEELDTQNHVLIDNTISGQKLGLSIIKDNCNATKEKAFHQWTMLGKQQEFIKVQKTLKEHMELIVNLRLKIKEIDLDNQNLVVENEQLRRTSMDGIFLAQTWKELSVKIKELSVDLADKSSIIENLLDENHGLAQNINLMKNRANQVMKNYR